MTGHPREHTVADETIAHAKVAPTRVSPIFTIMPPQSPTKPDATLDWGRTRYEEALARQTAYVAQHLSGEVGDTLIFTEHEPVFTIGSRANSDQHLVWNDERLSNEGIEVARTNRGGDITYHGPGQIVGYPIISLDQRRDLHAYLSFLEQVLINSLGSLGHTATRREGLTGIWLGSRKVAAIGVAVKRWITYHGFALNVNANLDHFQGIIPCGIASTDGTVTSLQEMLGHELDLDEVKAVLAREFWNLLPEFLAER
jgi:lipoyl(octanoyl) transferase